MNANDIALVMSGVLILIGGGVFGWLMHAWHSYHLEEKRFRDSLRASLTRLNSIASVDQ